MVCERTFRHTKLERPMGKRLGWGLLLLLAACRAPGLNTDKGAGGGQGGGGAGVCIGANCPPRCGELAECSEACVDLKADADNCGACGTRCAFAHGAAACSNGVCTLGTCAQGYADCDGRPANGCEVDLLADTGHCGTCANACPLVAANVVSS